MTLVYFLLAFMSLGTIMAIIDYFDFQAMMDAYHNEWLLAGGSNKE